MQDTTQYHRIHPIIKTGVDQDHYRWVKWDIHGNIEFVPQPALGYRGKTFWGTASYDPSAQKRAEDPDAYKERLKKANKFISELAVEHPKTLVARLKINKV